MHLYRRPRSPYYWCAYHLPSPAGAVLVRKSTKKRLLREAQTEAAKLREADLLAAGADSETARETLRILAEAQKKATAGELTIAAARVLLLEVAKAGGIGEIRQWSIREWVTEWLAARLPVTATSTAANYKTYSAHFLLSLGKKADSRIETLEAGDFRRFRDSFRKGRTARTANLGLKVMKSCFSAAVKEGVLLVSPAASVEILPELDSVTREPFTWSEIEHILAACPDGEWRAMVLLGSLAGLRLGDAARLKLVNVDFKAGTISLVAAKKARKGKAFTVPLHPRLSKELAALPRPISSSLPLLPSLAPLAISGRSGLSLRFSRILEAAAKANKPKTPEDVDWQGGTRGRSFHSLRHTFVSLLANSRVDSETRRLLSDHATESAHKIYTHLEIDKLRAAINKIGAV